MTGSKMDYRDVPGVAAKYPQSYLTRFKITKIMLKASKDTATVLLRLSMQGQTVKFGTQ